MNDDFKLHRQDQGADIPAPAGTPVREGERLPDPPPGRSRREGDQDARISSIPEELLTRVDVERGDIPLERWLFDAIENQLDEDNAGAECSRLEADMLDIHDALEEVGLPGAINATSIVDRIQELAKRAGDRAMGAES